MVNEFKVGDQVAHETRGSGVVDRLQETMLSGDLWPVVKLDAGYEWVSNPSRLRPRNFLAKIAEEQEADKIAARERFRGLSGRDVSVIDFQNSKTVGQQFNEVFRQPTVIGVDMASGPDVGFEAIATPQGFREFITDAYGIKRDPVTLLEIESDGIVAIKSIKETIREIS